MVSVILYDTTRFTVGSNYRFCLVLLQENDDQHSLVVGCSNVTKLKQIDNILVSDTADYQTVVAVTTDALAKAATKSPSKDEVISDISSFDKITDSTQDVNQPSQEQPTYDENIPESTTGERTRQSTTKKPIVEKAYASQLMTHINDSLIPSLSIGILITCVLGFIWAASKITHHRRSSPSTVCYAAADQHSIDIENGNRYLKLQATTTL